MLGLLTSDWIATEASTRRWGVNISITLYRLSPGSISTRTSSPLLTTRSCKKKSLIQLIGDLFRQVRVRLTIHQPRTPMQARSESLHKPLNHRRWSQILQMNSRTLKIAYLPKRTPPRRSSRLTLTTKNKRSSGQKTQPISSTTISSNE
jgi:hypothetical protein